MTEVFKYIIANRYYHFNEKNVKNKVEIKGKGKEHKVKKFTMSIEDYFLFFV